MDQLQPRAVSQTQLIKIMADVDGQPPWRTNANKACKYYDGDQLSPEVMQKLTERGQPPTVHNLIAPAIDGVLGMEAKTRTDLIVKADDPSEELELMAEALNSRFFDACRLGRMDRARSDAYASQLKCGAGFVEVYRSNDLFGSKYKIKNVPRDEVYWDWLSVEPDWSDARWVMRCRWIDVDELKALVPNKSAIIDQAVRGWANFVDLTTIEGIDPSLVSAYEEFRGWSREQSEWLSDRRDRVRLQIVYFKTVKRVPVLVLESGRVIEFDKNKLEHAVAVATNRAKVEVSIVNEIYESWYAGPHHLGDKKCAAPYGMFPIVPFFGYRKDSSGEPYGLAARAIPAQDEVNFRRIKLTWLLQAKRVIADKDATAMPRNKVLEEVERADGYIELNPERRNQKSIADSFKVEQDFNIAAQQFTVMQESMKLIQDTMGIYSSFLGQESGATSGIAIANLVEQGATTLGEINDNYRMGCQLVGELLLGYIYEDLVSAKNVTVHVNNEDIGLRKKVILNQVGEDGTLSNDLSKLRSHIVLAPIQQSPAYKQQLADRMIQQTAKLPPELQMIIIDLVMELSDIPNKGKVLERIRAAQGMPKDPSEMTEEELQQQQVEQQKARQQEELAFREALAQVSKLEQEVANLAARANFDNAKAESQQVQDAKTQVEMAEIMQGMEKMQQELDMLRGQSMQLIEQAIDNVKL